MPWAIHSICEKVWLVVTWYNPFSWFSKSNESSDCDQKDTLVRVRLDFIVPNITFPDEIRHEFLENCINQISEDKPLSLITEDPRFGESMAIKVNRHYTVEVSDIQHVDNPSDTESNKNDH